MLKIYTLIYSIKTIFDHQKKDIGPDEINGEPLCVTNLLLQIVGYAIAMYVGASLAFMGPNPIIDQEVPDFQTSYVFLIIVLVNFLM